MSFFVTQERFMAYIRDPENQPVPEGIEQTRLNVYKELFYNNIEGFVASAFPVLKSLYLEEDWHKLVRSFFVHHDCSSPFFLDISAEFLEFLQNEFTNPPKDIPYILELAHYEWIELDVSVCQEHSRDRSISDLIKEPLYFSSTARNVSYPYPVHLISAQSMEHSLSSEPYYYVVYRDLQDDSAFISSNAMTALLLNTIELNGGCFFNQVIDCVHEQVPQFSREQIAQGAEQIVTDLSKLNIVVTR